MILRQNNNCFDQQLLTHQCLFKIKVPGLWYFNISQQVSLVEIKTFDISN